MVHVLKRSVDLLQWVSVGDELVDLQLAFQVVVNNAWQLRAALHTTESSTLPHTAGDQLERSGGDFFAGRSNTNDDGCTPALVACFQSVSHDVDVTGAVKSVVASAVGHLDQLLHDGLAILQLGRVDESSGAKLLGPLLLLVVQVHNNDLLGLSLLGTLHNRQTDTASAENSNVVALLHIGSDGGSSVTGGDTTAQQTGLVEASLLVDSDNGNVSHNGVLRKGGAAHKVQKILALAVESQGAVRHHTTALSLSHGTTQVGLARLAELTLLTLGSVQGNDVVSHFHAVDAFADRLDNTGTLVSQNHWERTFWVNTRQGVGIGVADTGVVDLDPHLVGFWRINGDFLNGQWLSGLPGDGSFTGDWLALVWRHG